MDNREIKTRLLHACQNQVDTRLSKIKNTISNIESALFEESKSSSGDKYETGRAMLQIDRENAGRQLREIEQLAKILPRIDIQTPSDYVRLGSLVYTDTSIYFIGISLGPVSLDRVQYFCVAINSPIGNHLKGKQTGETFTLNGKVHTIVDIA